MNTLGQHLAGLSPDERIVLEQRLLVQRGIKAVDRIARQAGTTHDPLSFAQQRLWFLDRLDPGESHYNLFRCLRLKGPLDREALERSLAAIVSRHQSLRTTFADTPEGPVQIVGDADWFSLTQVDLSGRTVSDDSLRHLLREETHRPFDLARDLMLRASLFRLSEVEHVLCVVAHHIASDEWSLQILYHELAEFYAAFASGRSARLADLSIQYSDYAQWQRTALAAPLLQSQLAYWRDRLRDAPPLMDLPADSVRPPVQTYRGTFQKRVLPKHLSEQLLAFGRESGTTPFMTLLTAFNLLVSRWAGRSDVVLGTPVAGRNRIELESLIGFFINTLVLRTDLSGNPTFRELLDRTRGVALGALAHQDVPFEKLVEELHPERSFNRTPLVQVMLNWINVPRQPPRLTGLSVEFVEAPLASTKFDLTLYAWEQNGRVALVLVYNADLFAEPRMSALLDQLEQLLDQALRSPDTPIGGLSLVTPSAGRVLPNPAAPLPSLATAPAHELFTRQAGRAGQRTAVADAQEEWSYAELDERSNQLAHCLIAGGIEKGDCVAIYAHRSAALVWALLGVMKSGARFVILEFAYPALRLGEIIAAAAPKALIKVARAGPLPPILEQSLAECGCRCRLELPSRAEAQANGLLSEFSTQPLPRTVALDDPAYIAFTSGSTGGPKGIVATHRPLSHFIAWHVNTFALDEGDRFSALSGLAHDPLLRDLLTPLSIGATLVLPHPDEIEPGRLADWIRREKITVCHLTPQMGRILVPAPLPKAPPMESLRYLFFGGDVLTPPLISAISASAPNATCVNFYGATETPQAIGAFVVSRDAADGPLIPIGQGITGSQLLVLNAAGGLAGIGELGEIVIRSPHLAEGYLDEDHLTSERFITNPFTGDPADRIYRTGDGGRYRPDGNVELAGRLDRQVKIRGFRVEPAEVEAALGCHPAVERAHVVFDENGADSRLVAYVACPRQPFPSDLELRRWLRERLPEALIPAAIVSLDRLQLTPNGKVDVAALPSPASPVHSVVANGQPPALTELESQIAAIWRDVLGIHSVGTHDNFLDLGGHSLLAIRVIARIEAELGLKITPRTLMFQTLGQIAMAHGQRPEAARTAPRALEPFYFGSPDEALFGCYHPPTGARSRDCGVLLCSPLGHEYVRTHRAYRRLASRLSEAGFHVLRFDYFSCGDSAGDDGQTDVARLLADISAAADELLRRSGAADLCLGGLRMGATLAALAAESRKDVAAVVLWDPVIRGSRYLADLARWHRLKGRSLPHPKRRESKQPETVLGFRYSRSLLNEVQGIDLRSGDARPARRILLLETVARSESRRLTKHLAALGADVEHEVVKDHRIWRPDLEKILVPARVIDTFEDWLDSAFPEGAAS